MSPYTEQELDSVVLTPPDTPAHIIRKQDVHHHTPRRPEAGNSFTINDEQASSLRVEDTLDSDVQSKLIVEQTSSLRVKDTLDSDAQSKLIVEQTSPLRVKDTLDSDAQSKLIVVKQTSPLDSDAQFTKLIVDQTNPLRVEDTLDSDTQSKLIVKQTRAKRSARRKRVRPPTDRSSLGTSCKQTSRVFNNYSLGG